MIDLNATALGKPQPLFKTLLKDEQKKRRIRNMQLQGQKVETALGGNGEINVKSTKLV